MQPKIFSYPQSTELRRLAALIVPRLTLNSPIFKYFPFVNSPSHLLQWSQRDTYTGMMDARALNGQPARVAMIGEREFIFKPGVYSNFMEVDEATLTVRSAEGNSGALVVIDDLVQERLNILLARRMARVEWLAWQVAVNGMFVAHDIRGAITHRASFAIQRYTSPYGPWSNRATARPMEDLSNIRLMGRGMGTNFGAGAVAFVNAVTEANISGNTNDADIGGKRVGFGNTVATLDEVNNLLRSKGAPSIVVYDEGYEDENGDWVPYIPDGHATIIGKLNNGETLGEFRFTRNMNTTPPGQPAAYTKVVEKGDEVPYGIEVHDGFNGGPVIFYPGSIVNLDASV